MQKKTGGLCPPSPLIEALPLHHNWHGPWGLAHRPPGPPFAEPASLRSGTVCDRIENSDRTGTGPDWDHFGRNRTGLQARKS